MSRSSRPPRADAGFLDGVTKLGGAALAMVLAAAAAPGLLGGAAIAFALRSLRLRWSFGALIAVALALPLALDPVDRVRRVQTLATELVDGSAEPDARDVIGLLWPLWLALAGVVGVVGKRALERRARLHGGRGERALQR